MDEEEIDGEGVLAVLKTFDSVLGFLFSNSEKEIADPEVLQAAEKRFIARKEKNSEKKNLNTKKNVKCET